MFICRSCGANAPPTRSTCHVCRTRFEDNKTVVYPRDDGLYFARTAVEMRCRRCGYLTSAGRLKTRDSFTCAHCGQDQAMYGGYWRDALADAWCLADLNGEHARVRDDESGVDRQDSRDFHISAIGRTGSTVRSLFGPEDEDFRQRMVVTPGHPVCESCGQALDVEVAGGGRTLVRCRKCRVDEEHAIPEGALHVPPGLVGVIGVAHRADLPHASTTRDGEMEALHCPSCRAALDLGGTSRAVTCDHCGTTSLLPLAARCQVGDDHGSREWWWLVFEGWSPERKRLIRLRDAPEPEPPRPAPKRKRRGGCLNVIVYTIFISFGLCMIAASILLVFAMAQDFF